MNWGMKNRLSQIMGQDDSRCVMLAVDHGYFLGPTEGLEAPREVIGPLLPFADSIMLTRGILRTCVRPESCVPVVLRVSGGRQHSRRRSFQGGNNCKYRRCHQAQRKLSRRLCIHRKQI